MSLVFDETKILNDSGDGLLCRIHLLKSQFSSGEIPNVLRQVEYQKIRTKLEKTPVLESSDFLKVCFICSISQQLFLCGISYHNIFSMYHECEKRLELFCSVSLTIIKMTLIHHNLTELFFPFFMQIDNSETFLRNSPTILASLENSMKLMADVTIFCNSALSLLLLTPTQVQNFKVM